MTSLSEQHDDLEAAVEQLARYVVLLERAIAPPSPQARGVTDTPGLGVLLALEIFGPLRPSTVAELGNMRSGTTSKRIERLERASLVTRRLGAVPGDRRGVVVEITDAGRTELARIERVALETGAELLAALQPLTLAPTDSAAASGDPPGYPVLAALFRFVSLIDHTVLRAVGDHDLLHPTDPRPLLLLVDLERHGPRAAGSMPGLLDRSRSATHRLVGRMTDERLVEATEPLAGSPRGLTAITESGRGVLRSVVDALGEDLPSLQPAIGELTRALTTATSVTAAPERSTRAPRG
jgi:DNA-binding MarR family transcriptional regulator